MSEAVAQLNESLLSMLQCETFVLLNTVDAESGGPTSTAISWIYAVSPSTLRICGGSPFQIGEQHEGQPLVTITVFGESTVHAINGRAAVKQDLLEEVPFKICCFDVEIEAVRNALFYGAQLEFRSTICESVRSACSREAGRTSICCHAKSLVRSSLGFF
jgi:hypothetical protein